MDSLVQWFTANLSGVISKEAIIFIISMIPILELRGGLLAASPALLNVPILRAIPICIVGNILPIPFILLLIRHVLEWMKKVPCFRGIALWLERKAMSKKGQIEKYEFWGLMEEMRAKAGAQNYHGHGYMDLQRFAEDTRHMIIFDVLTNDSPVGWKGERTRLFLSDTGYEKALDSQEKGQIKILSHAKVRQGNLHYDRSDQLR